MPYKDADQRRDYQRQWLAARRTAFFTDKACVSCGSADDLRLDHVDPTQKVSHRIWSWSENRRSAELAKCQILCEPCHKVKTWGVDRPLIFGYDPDAHNDTRYRAGCRCGICFAAHAEVGRAWRLARAG